MKKNQNHYPKICGFTLIELMIVVAIIGILILIAIPSYKNYTKRAHYTEIVQATAPYKIGIEECYQTTDNLNECKAGKNGVPEAIINNTDSGLVESVQVNSSGIIIVTPKKKYGLTSQDTYLLTPIVGNNTLTWHASGGGVNAGYAR